MHDGILIGEGVVLDARPASFVTRSLAALLDLAVVGVVVIVLAVVAVEQLGSLDGQWLRVVSVVLSVLVMVVVPVTVETLTRGRSLGKLAAGLRVVRDDGGPVRFRHAFSRALVGVGELWLTLGSVALITSLSNPRGKRLGDMLAGTYVIRVRGGRGWTAPLGMPPELAGWARAADIRRLPDGLALAARQFLDRAARLAPASRASLANELAGRVEPFVAPSPPPGTPAEAFLHAVLFERRDRELARGKQEHERAQARAATLHRLPYAVPDPRT
ncbi:RDD family protein [Isoptericola sp. NEAU-Y5]|uniref:RDD family protein n=1 Tax=Isoptericola luteus TaxID=2879484 RepID=A0ABS7ZI01_9MICO|nr:RDD family protein [Isoptericola sp. NEAU-Y5]MCA5894647.1 RDD family protein [Isoptericola sp. NEAU-Y5]